MCLGRIIARIGFALAAASILTAFGLTLEYLPLFSALAH